MDYDERKHQYDTLQLQLESSMSRLEQEVKKFQEEIVTNEQQAHVLDLEVAKNNALAERAAEELKIYVNKGDEGKKSVRERLHKLISESEKRGKLLKEEQKKVKENLTLSSKQVKLWGDLERLFEVKKRCMDAALNGGDDSMIHREPGTETLVL